MTAGRSGIRLMVIDDHPIVRDGVQLLVRGESDIRVVGSAETARAALAAIPRVRPDVVLLDLRLPDMLAPEAVRRLRTACPRVKVVVFTAYADHAGMADTLAAGVDGWLLKDIGTMDLVQSLRQVMADVAVIDSRVTPQGPSRLQEQLFRLGLTRREYETLRLVALGMTNPEIAEELSLAPTTVKTYLQGAMQKLGARNRVEAVARAQQAHLL